MYYIKSTPNEQGYYGNPMTQPFDGCVALPDDLFHSYISANGFVNITVEDGTVTCVEKNEAVWEAWNAEYQPAALDALRVAKMEELSAACNASIDAGTSVTMPDGSQADFTYSTADQANVSEMFLACMMGATSYPYHANDDNCKIYTAAEIMAIYGTLSMYKTGQITYHNQLKQYVKSLTSPAEVEAVVYGQPLTGDYLTTYNDLMATATMQMQELISKIGDGAGTTS